MGEPLSARIERKNEKRASIKNPPNQTNAWEENGERKRNGVWVASKKSRNRKSLSLARKIRFSNSHAPFPLPVSPVPFAAQTV